MLSDGSLRRYFSCAPGAGSFIRHELLDIGIDAMSALISKYEDIAELATTHIDVGNAGKKVPVLIVGEAKVRKRQRLALLSAASLRGARVATVLPTSLAVCANLRELDLRASLLPDWNFLRGTCSVRLCRFRGWHTFHRSFIPSASPVPSPRSDWRTVT